MEQPRAAVQGRAAPGLPSRERGKEEQGGELKITGKEQGSSIQRDKYLPWKEGISLVLFIFFYKLKGEL